MSQSHPPTAARPPGLAGILGVLLITLLLAFATHDLRLSLEPEAAHQQEVSTSPVLTASGQEALPEHLAGAAHRLLWGIDHDAPALERTFARLAALAGSTQPLILATWYQRPRLGHGDRPGVDTLPSCGPPAGA